MNLQFINKQANDEFSKLLDNSESVRNWLINRLGGYNNIDHHIPVLTIYIDSYTNKETIDNIDYYSFEWNIISYPTDPKYGDMLLNETGEHIINGGLIFRGIETVERVDQWGNETTKQEAVYSSHT